MVVLLLLGQFITSLLGTFLVQCADNHGHKAIEVVHVGSCQSIASTMGSDHTANVLLNSETCVDVSFSLPVVITRKTHRAIVPMPAYITHSIAELPQRPLPIDATTNHVLLAHPAQLLARSVILLI